MNTNAYTLINATHETDQINKGTWFASANNGEHFLIADSLSALQEAAKAAREDGHEVSSTANVSLTDSSEEEQSSERRGNC